MKPKSLMDVPHLHKEIEIIYVIDGGCIAFADKKHFNLSSGDIFITFPNQIHYYEKSIKGKYMVLIFSTEILFEIGNYFSENIPECNVIRREDFKNNHILEDIYNTSNTDKLTLCGYMNIITALIIENIKTTKIINSESKILYRINDYCSNHFNEKITLDIISKELNFSKFYISHIINNNLNISFCDYINNFRISEACNLLIKTNLSVTEISEISGFGTIRSFNRAFMRNLNNTPKEYRKIMK